MQEQSIELIKLLWVEDETEGGLVERKAYLESSDNYELVIKRNATDAEIAIKNETFDIVIFDIRIPPGFGQYWERLHNKNDHRLGLELIQKTYHILAEKKIPIGICTIERWFDIKDHILKIDPDFNERIQYKHKDDIVFPEDFEIFIQNLKL